MTYYAAKLADGFYVMKRHRVCEVWCSGPMRTMRQAEMKAASLNRQAHSQTDGNS